jgi:hypothetical protein
LAFRFSKTNTATLDALWETVKAERIADIETRAAAKNELLDRLGITADEAALLAGMKPVLCKAGQQLTRAIR